MKLKLFFMAMLCVISLASDANNDELSAELSDLKNLQINTPIMISAGLPNQRHFQVLQSMGVTTVVDLIPGDRSEHAKLMKAMSLSYHNIQVDWQNPTLEDFQQYVELMTRANKTNGKTLTHCRLNWRGAVFTYLYRVTQLNEAEAIARKDMLAIWQPNEVWQKFINQVMKHYQP